MPSLLEILNDPNYVNANQATKEAIFNKYSATDPNYTDANDATKEAIKQRFGFGAPVAKPVEAPGDTRKPEDVGFLEGVGAATKKGFSALGDIASGLGLAGTSVFGSKEETAKKMADIKAAAEEEAKGTKTLTAGDIQRIAEEKGYIKAGTQVPAYVVEQILQSAPSMALPLAVGAAASPFLTPIGGAIAGVATYGVQQFGNFLARQAQEKNDPEELEVAKAALTAAGTAPIGYFADRFTVGLTGIGTKKAMSEVYAELGKRGVAGEVGKRAAKGAGLGIIAEAPTEVLEAVAERYQAGLDLTGADAMNEYKESFFGAAAAGGGIGAGAKAAGAYGEYKQARRLEDSLGQVRSGKNAFQEAEEADVGVDTGINQQGVPLSDQQELDLAAGVRDAGPGDLEGNQLPLGSTGVGEGSVDSSLDAKIKEAQAYIRELQAIDPNDPRIEDAVAYIQQLQNPQAFNAPGAVPPAATSQEIKQVADQIYKDNFLDNQSSPAFKVSRELKTTLIPAIEFKEKDIAELETDLIPNAVSPEQKAKRERVLGALKKELTDLQTRAADLLNSLDQQKPQGFNAPGQQGGFDFGAADETTQRGIDTEMTETPGFALQQETGVLPTGAVAPIEDVAEGPKAKMMLIGEGANPLAPLKSFFKSLKTATNAPQQVRDFNAEVDNLIEDVSEFIGQTTKQVSRYAEEGQPSPGKGPDVSAPLVGVPREQRLNFLDNFFNSLSNAPAGQENLTGTLSQRLRGMNLNDQTQVLGQLTNVPNINTVRGVRDLRAKLKEALAKFEGDQIQEPVEKAAVYKGDETQTYAVRRAINILKNIPAKLRTPEERAAMVYFERWGFAMAMRSAAFDLGSKPNTLFSGPIFKGQNGKEAELFKKWTEENLPVEEYRKLNVTINEFKEMTARAEKLEADAERVSKGRGVVQRVTQPTGKVSEGFVKEAGLGKFKQPSAVSKLEAQRFYPMHPAMQQAIEEGNLDAALSILEASGNKFHSGLAKRLRSLGLQTGVTFDQQEQLAQQILTANYAGQMEDVFKFVAATDPALFNEYFKNPTDYAKVKAGLDKITDKGIEGQVIQLKDAYQSAINVTQSSGTYVAGLDVINLNRQQGGASNYTFIHELVHAATVYSLSETNFDKLTKQQQAAVVELKNLYEFAKRTGLNEYGFQNVEEFVAEAFSNKEFQDVLKTLPYKGAQDQFRSLVIPTKYAENKTFMKKLKQAKDDGSLTFEFDETAEEAIDRNIREEVAKNRGEGVIYDEEGRASTTGTAAEVKTYATEKGISKKLKEKAFAEAYNNAKAKGKTVFTWEGVKYFTNFDAKDTSRSVWDKFTELVAKMFGMNNVLGYTLANANVIMQAPPAFTTQAAAFNANKKKSILAGKLAVGPGPMNFAEKLFGNKPGWESMKVAMPGFLQDMNDTLRKYYLGAFTLRQLNDMIGHRIPQFREFLNTTEKMLDERNRILEQTKDITDKWMRYQSKYPEEAKKMNLLMLDATLQGKDPAKGFTGNDKIDDAWNAIGKDGQEIYVAVRDFYRNRLNDYIQTNLENKKASLIARGYTQAEIDAHPAISKLGTPPIADMRQYLLKKGFTLGEIEAHEEIAAVETFFKKHNVEPYFPVRRFGRFSLQLGKGANKEFYLFESAGERRAFLPKRLDEMKAEGKAVPTEDEIFERNSIGNLTSATSKMDEFKFLQELKNIVRNEQGSDIPKLRENLEDSLEQLYFLQLPDQNIRKMFMNRKGTAGMNTDMLRAFTTSAFHMAYQHSRYKYSRELYGSITDAEARVGKEPGKEGKVNEDYLNELKQRLSYIMNPTDTGTIPSFLSNVSFIWYMTAPASALVNMLGVPAIGVPVVAAKFGWKNTSSKMAEYAKKFTSTGFKDDNQEWDFPTLDRFKGLTDIQRKAYEQLVADGVIDITLSHDLVGMTEAPSNLYTGRSKTAMKWLSGAFHGAEKFNREVVSMATFDLAYEKAKKAGYTDEAAFKKAISDAKDLTYKSMFDYSTLNKPRYFQNEYAKVILQFKQFSQQMTYLLARSVYEGAYKKYSANELKDIRDQLEADHKFNKVNPKPLTDADLDAMVQEYIKGVRSEAIKRLGGTLGMTAMFAGVTGLPLWSVVAGTMNALQAVFGEDDEEYDFNNWFKNWLNNNFGGFAGDSISRGVVTQTLGVNLADRMGLNDLWFRDSRKSSDEVTALQNTLINLLGPTAGLMINSAEAVKQMNDGHLYRAMETASPAFLKNFMKGARFAEEGRAVNLKGDELVGDVSGYESAAQTLGFAPERVAQRQKSNIEMKTIEQKIKTKRQDLLNAFFMAVDNDDDDLKDRVLEKIGKFNTTYGELAITPAQLQKSIKTRYVNRALAESTGGISIDKKLIGRLSEMQDYGNPNE
jgi:hypothetical protein